MSATDSTQGTMSILKETGKHGSPKKHRRAVSLNKVVVVFEGKAVVGTKHTSLQGLNDEGADAGYEDDDQYTPDAHCCLLQ